jgi:hypothetical protein
MSIVLQERQHLWLPSDSTADFAQQPSASDFDWSSFAPLPYSQAVSLPSQGMNRSHTLLVLKLATSSSIQMCFLMISGSRLCAQRSSVATSLQSKN